MATEKKNPSGISAAAIEGAQQASENNEAPLGGGTVAFPAPSAQPTNHPGQETQRPAEVDNREETDEDDDAEWRRAGGKK